MATLESKEKVFYCTNCKEERTDPVTLACYHSVCQQCLTMSQTFHKDEDNFCPVCETNAQCSDSADSLRSQLGTCIESASRTLEDLLVKSGLMYCNVCCLHNQRNKVTHQCLDCADVLCDECHTGHQSSSATYSHRVVAIEDVNSGKYIVEAKKNFPCGEINHRGRTYAYFCQSCVIPICELCILFQHRGHDVLTLDDAVQNCSRKLDERSQQLSKCITESTSMLERFRNLHRDVSSIREATVKCIRDKAKKAVDLILEQEQAAVRKLSKACDRQLKLTSTLKSDLEQISRLSPKLLSLTNLVLGPGKDVSVLVLHKDLEQCFNESKQLQDATDVFAAKLKTPVFVVRCDIPPSSVISITHSFQNADVGPGDSKKDDKSASPVLSTNVVSAANADDGATRKQAEGMRDKSASPVLSTNVVSAANADDGATRKQAEGMKDISSSNSFTSETVNAKANPHLSDTEIKCLPGEIISGIPFAVVAPRFKFESSISGYVVTDILRSNENLFPEPSAVDGSSSGSMRDGSNICRQGDSSCFKVTASLMIVGQAGKALLVRCASSRYPFEGPDISFSEMSSGHMDSTKVETSVPSAIKQGVTSDALMTEQMTSRGLKGYASDSPYPSGPVAGYTSKSGLKGLDSCKLGAFLRTFDDKLKAPGNPENTGTPDIILPDPQNTGTQDMILPDPQNTGTQDMILPDPQNTGTPDMILPDPQNTGTQDMILPDPQNTGTPDMILPELQNTGTPDMILPDPQNTETHNMILPEPQNTETPDMILPEPQNTGTPDMILPDPQNTETPDMVLPELQNTGTPDMILPDPQNTETANMVLVDLWNTGTPDMILPDPQNTETANMVLVDLWNTGTPDMILPDPQNTETANMVLVDLWNTGTPDMILPDPQNTETANMVLVDLWNTGTPDMILPDPQNTETANMVLVDLWNTGTPDMILPEPQNTETHNMILPEPQNTGTQDMILPEPQNTGTQDMILPEPRNTETPDTILAEPRNTETPDMMLAEPRKSEIHNMILAEPWNTEAPNMILAEPQNIETPAEPLNTGHPEMIPSRVQNWKTPAMIPSGLQNWNTPDMISAISRIRENLELIPAAPKNRKTQELVPAGSEDRKTRKLVPAGSEDRKTRELVPAGSEDRKTRELVPAGQENRRTLELVPAGSEDRKTRELVPAGQENRRTLELIPAEPQSSKTPESNPKGSQRNCCIC